MKLVTNTKTVSDLLAEVLLEYSILEANPFAAAEKDEGGGEEAGGDAEAKGGKEEEKADTKPKEGGDELSIKFDQSAVKGYNTNTDWKASEAPVKKITKKGIEVDINGTNVLVNFDDITEHVNRFFKQRLREQPSIKEAANDRFLQSAARNLAGQMRGKAASKDTLMNRLNSMPLANRLNKEELAKIVNYAMTEMGLTTESTSSKLDAEDKKQIADLEREMGAVANQLGSDFSAASDEIKQQVEEMPEDELNEHKQKLNEVIGVTAVIGFILALPKLVEIITKAISKLIKLIQKLTKTNPPKTEQEKVGWAEKIIEFTHKWHKLYIKAFYYMFKMSGLYKKAGITDESTKMKVAKIFYYTVVAGLAVAAGIGAVGAFKTAASQAAHGSEFALGTFEGAMAAIKSGEVVEFLGELGISATAAS